MQCARCGTLYDGKFCPACGAPSAAPAPAPAGAAVPASAPAPFHLRCSRCGTVYEGKFCPVCGLPSWGMWAPPPPPQGSGIFPVLNFVWVVSLVAFLLILGIAVAATFYVIAPISTGVGDIRRGTTVDGSFDTGPGSWAFSPWSPSGASESWSATGGNPGGHVVLQLDGLDATPTSGYFSQAVSTSGSSPFVAFLRFDYELRAAGSLLQALDVYVFVDGFAGPPILGQERWTARVTSPAWTPATSTYLPTGEMITAIDLSDVMGAPGTYHVKVAAIASNRAGAGGTVTELGLDNLELRWATNAFVDVVVIVPFPVVLYFTQDPTVFLLWTAGLVATVVASLVVTLRKDARATWKAIAGDALHLPAKLRSKSSLVAIMQTFFAVLFVDYVIAFASNAPDPGFLQSYPDWYLYFALLNASVYEEIIFRVLIIGAPMVIGSIALRVLRITQGSAPRGTSAGRYVLGSFRYLYGGAVDRRSSHPALLVSGLLLVVNAVIFGFAHAPGWGDWKILPAGIAGLAMGYLFLRHGLAAAILFHLATDMFVAAGYIVGFDSPIGLMMALAFFVLGLVIPGPGFFVYYLSFYPRRLYLDLKQRSARKVYVGAPPSSPPNPAAPPVSGAPLPPGYSPPNPPPGYGTSPVQFRCPRCAWVEAFYEAGHFRCARCGYQS